MTGTIDRNLSLRASSRACAALLVACLGGCGAPGGEPDPPEATASLTITIDTPRQANVAVDIVASGTIAAWQETPLGVELSGIRVDRVLVEVGSRVKAGDSLVALDARSLAVAARQAEASLAQAQASLALAQSAGERGKSLLAQRLISSSDAEELDANLLRALAQLDGAQAERDAARLRVGYATLRAPHAGIISARTVQSGQIVSAGEELLRLIRDGRLEWRAEVSQSDLVLVKPGAEVLVSAPSGEGVPGRVRAVAPALDAQTRTGIVYADLPEPGALRAGMFAQGRVVLGEVEASVLPREAVVYRDGYPYVFVLGDDSRVSQRRVEVGAPEGDLVPVRNGVGAGERVAVVGAGFLSDGDLVRVVAEGEA